MDKRTHFLGQSKGAGSEVAQPPADTRLHHALLQPHLQGRGQASEDEEC